MVFSTQLLAHRRCHIYMLQLGAAAVFTMIYRKLCMRVVLSVSVLHTNVLLLRIIIVIMALIENGIKKSRKQIAYRHRHTCVWKREERGERIGAAARQVSTTALRRWRVGRSFRFIQKKRKNYRKENGSAECARQRRRHDQM